MTSRHQSIFSFCLAAALTVPLLAWTVSVPASPAVASSPVDVPALKKRIVQGHVLEAGVDVQIKLNGPEVTVSTMLSKQQKEPTTDCKIDAAMIAKTVFETPKNQFARVKVRFYDPKNLSRYYMVRVTAGDVAAFSSRRLSTQQFLESLEVVEQSDAKTEMGTAALAAASAGKTEPPGSAPIPIQVLAVAPSDSFVPYESPAGALVFDYPSTFSAVERPDKDTLAKFEGAAIDGTHYEMTLSMAPAHAMQPARFAQFTDQLIFQSLSGYRHVRSEDVLIGERRNIPAHINEIDFGAESSPTRLTVVHFRIGPFMYTLGFLSRASEHKALMPLINHTLLSVHPSGRLPNIGSLATIAFRDARIGVAFDYPKVWRDSATARGEFIKCLEGPMGPFAVELKLGDAEVPGVTSNKDIAELVERRVLRPMKNYTRLDGTNITFGRGSKIAGYRLASRFTVNNVSVVEQMVFFSHRGRHYCLSFMLYEGAPSIAKLLFDSILSTVTLD
jgi:hypothetical protein